MSINAGAIRFLVPKLHKNEILQELQLVEHVVITFDDSNQIVHVLFEDYSSQPYQLQIQYLSIDRKLPQSEAGKRVPVYFYFQSRGKLKRYKKTREAEIRYK